MIETTIQMLRARRDERVAVIGVLAACFCDDLDEAVRRLENCRDAAREFEKALPRGGDGRRRRGLAKDVAAVANDLLLPMRQLAERGR